MSKSAAFYVAVFVLLCLLFLLGCSDGEFERPSTSPHTSGRFYFNKADKVDNVKIGPKMYRVENDEVVCYIAVNSGTSCTWKSQ